MTKRLPTAAIAVLLAMSIMPVADDASAMPMANARVIKNVASPAIETVQWRGGGWGFGAAAGSPPAEVVPPGDHRSVAQHPNSKPLLPIVR